jgi:hypothetical protein
MSQETGVRRGKFSMSVLLLDSDFWLLNLVPCALCLLHLIV